MRALGDWIREAPERYRESPWLVLGKGPTFARRGELDLDRFCLLGLNHVVAQQRVDVAHLIDIDVVESVGEALLENADVVLMPRVPHVRLEPSLRRLEDFLPGLPVLRRLADEGRLIWYNAASSHQDPPGSPTVSVRYFSSEAAFDVLGHLGVRDITTVGIDGGVSYSGSFAHLDNATRLANGQASFDLQFVQLERIARRWGITYRPAFEPLRVFVGCSEEELVPAHVLAHSIRQRSSIPVSVAPMSGLDLPMPAKRENCPRTAFSFARFAIPRLAGYHGRALYLDSDMLVFGDIAELDALEFGEATVLCTYQYAPEAWQDNASFKPGRQFSVMVLDCDRLRWDVEGIVRGLDAGAYSYAELMFDLCIVPPAQIADTVPTTWNHLEHKDDGTRNVHFTVVPTQPWRSYDNPLREVWLHGYREAMATGAVPVALVRAGVSRGILTPDLLDALELAPKPAPLNPLALELDAVRQRLAALEESTVRRRVLRAGLRTATPVLERMRTQAPSHRVTQTAERAARRIRGMLS